MYQAMYAVRDSTVDTVKISTECKFDEPSLNSGLVFCIHFLTNFLKKDMNPSPPDYELNSRKNGN